MLSRMRLEPVLGSTCAERYLAAPCALALPAGRRPNLISTKHSFDERPGCGLRLPAFRCLALSQRLGLRPREKRPPQFRRSVVNDFYGDPAMVGVAGLEPATSRM